jgi:hypothetical protein
MTYQLERFVMKAMLTIAIVALAAAAATEAQTVKVWKWVDHDGRVTYSEEPPAAGMARTIEEKHFDPNEITVQTTPAANSEAAITWSPAPASDPAAEAAVQAAARERLLRQAAGAAEAEREREASAAGER